MKLIRFLYILIYKAFTSDLSARKVKVVYSEVEEEIVQREGQEGVMERSEEDYLEGFCYEPQTGESKNVRKRKSKQVTNYSLNEKLK